MGTALVIGLVKGCRDHGCRMVLNARAVAPILDGRHVKGLVVEHDGRKRNIHARRGVVLATGGFEWDLERLEEHFPGPCDFLASPPGNDGAAHRIASAAGAELAHMDQANITGGIPLSPGLRPFGISYSFHREPNAIIVNRDGRRFVNEYRFNIGQVLDVRDPESGQPLHLPAWLISDAAFLKNSPVVRRFAARNPGWIIEAEDIELLADKISVPAKELDLTVNRYNSFCQSGVDKEFSRHEDKNGAPVLGENRQHRMLPITSSPFIAIPFNRTIVSTKGGPRTDRHGRVVDGCGKIIPGLYCAGAAMANPIGTWAIGAGTTLGPNMTWGYICSKAVISESRYEKERKPDENDD